MRALLWTVFGIILLAAATLGMGRFRWHALTRQLFGRLEQSRVRTLPPLSANDLEALPEPVRCYLRGALTDGQQRVAAVEIETEGTFNIGDHKDNWQPFRARQRAVTREPGFVWNGAIRLLPGVNMQVHDAYIAGEGILRPSIAGLIDVAHIRGTGEIARGELMRFLAEAPWYPTALLPDAGVTWQSLDEHSATATMRDHDTTVMLTFRFSEDGMIASIRSEARGRTVGAQMVPTPWEGRWGDYASQNGMCVPRRGEVAWILPEGRKPYWRGRATRIGYEFKQ